MNMWIWLALVIAVLVVVALVVMSVIRKRQTESLRHSFGPEYEQTMKTAENRRAAEAALRDRTHERQQLKIRELSAAAITRYTREWHQVQEHFVDAPSESVTAADNLLVRVMAEQGYPVDKFEAQADLVSVDHPDIVQNYRNAHRVYEQNQSHRASTEDLRSALLSYRIMFEELLPEPATGGTTTSRNDRDSDR
jgi:hypothetical protein